MLPLLLTLLSFAALPTRSGGPALPPPPSPTPVPSGRFVGPAELPRVVPTFPAHLLTAACTDTVRRNLQRALSSARGGSVLCLDGDFVGSHTVPARRDTGWLVIRSLVSRTPVGSRARPSQVGGYARIVTASGGASSALIIRGQRVVVTELELALDPELTAIVGTIVDVPTPAADVVLDRLWIHASPTQQVQRCVALNGGAATVQHSWLGDCHAKGYDSQAIAGWNGTGPYLIDDNHLEGAGENVMFGGAHPEVIGMVPSDITITRNYLYTPLAWKKVWTKKNLFELKNAVRVHVAGNVMSGSWTDGQVGFGVMIYSTNQGNGRCTWCRVTDVAFVDNRIVNVASGINLSARQTRVDTTTRRVAFVGTVIDSINGTGDGRLIQLLNGGRDLLIDSLVATGGGGRVRQFLILDPSPAWIGVTITNSVAEAGQYGIFRSASKPGDAALRAAIGPPLVFRNVTLLGPMRQGYGMSKWWPSGEPPLAKAIRARVAAATAGVVVPP